MENINYQEYKNKAHELRAETFKNFFTLSAKKSLITKFKQYKKLHHESTELNLFTDRQLVDMGFNVSKVRMGIKGHPWR